MFDNTLSICIAVCNVEYFAETAMCVVQEIIDFQYKKKQIIILY